MALVGATIVDGSGAAPQADAVVVVRGGRIEAVMPSAGFSLPERTTQVDVGGKWIIPGLIDAHGHVAPWALSRYLAWGVTTVRDAHGTRDTILVAPAAARRLASSASPRIYAAGAMIDGRPTTYADAIGVDDASDARKAVDQLSVAGADFIKIYTRVDAPLLRAIVDEASTFNLKVTGHLGLTDAVTAAAAGIGAIEHLSGHPRGRRRRIGVLQRALSRLLAGLDGVRARVGRARLRRADAGGRRGGWPAGHPDPYAGAARDVQPARRLRGYRAARAGCRAPRRSRSAGTCGG